MASAPPSWFLYCRCRGHLQARGDGSSTAAPPHPVSAPTRLAATRTTAPLPKGHCQCHVDVVSKTRRTTTDLPQWHTSWGRHCSARTARGRPTRPPRAHRTRPMRCRRRVGFPPRTPTGVTQTTRMEDSRPPVRLEKYMKVGDGIGAPAPPESEKHKNEAFSWPACRQ